MVRHLEFRETIDGWAKLPADPNTIEGATEIVRWICPSLTDEEARQAAEEGLRRMLRCDTRSLRGLITELFAK